MKDPAQVYKPPAVHLNQDVLWYERKGERPFAAKVLAVGHDTVAVGIMEPNTQNFRLRDGVRHVSDARSNPEELQEGLGLWDFTETHKEFQVLEAKVEELFRMLAEHGMPSIREAMPKKNRGRRGRFKKAVPAPELVPIVAGT